MQIRNQAFENSLRCLQHPLSLMSIAVLLFNDHVLKIVSPSWLTGKLSDFAGLFFFPFIVAAIFSLLFTKVTFTPEQLGRLAFGFVAVWFLLLKTFPLANHLTSNFSSLLIGSSTYFVMDWTDTTGLIMLLPSWKIWQKPIQVNLSQKSYISLAAGLFACLATSPVPPPFDSVVALAYQDGILYAESVDSYYLVRSTDNGDNWESIYPRENEREEIESLLRGHPLPVQVCDPKLQQNCYRIDGGESVLVSNNSGTSWNVGWEVPSERRDFVLRIAKGITTHDLLLIEKNGSSFLFVAVGNNGVLRKQLPNGVWERIGVEEAQPAPFSAPDLMTAISIVQKELLTWLGVAVIGYLITNIAIWNRFSNEKKLIDLTDWLSVTILLTFVFVVAEVAIALAGFLLLIVLDFLTPFMTAAFIDILSKLAIMIAIFAPFGWLIRRTDKWILKIAPNETARSRIILFCSLTVSGIVLIGGLPWLLWAWGSISKYQSAQITSIVISALILVIGYYSIHKSK